MAKEKNTCKHLVRDGVCGGVFDVCCVYQNSCIGLLYPEQYDELHRLRETWCTYPVSYAPKDYQRAIHEIAEHVKCGDENAVL